MTMCSVLATEDDETRGRWPAAQAVCGSARCWRDTVPGIGAAVTAPEQPQDGATESFSPILPDDVEELARSVLERVSEQERSLATAESCTGGMLASLLTDVKGASGAFERGFVVYSEPAKCELLGLDQADIDRCGVVSKEVAVAMAEGALARSRADIAVSTTGFADEGDEPGLVHFACAAEGRPTIHREEHFGAIGRGPVRIASMRVALTMIDEQL
jgi:nicotinamide-nucleotide amidase